MFSKLEEAKMAEEARNDRLRTMFGPNAVEEMKPPPLYVRQYRASLNIGRNDPCHCGSNLKFKRCCLNKEIDDAS